MTITAPKRSEKNLVGRDDEGRQAQSSCDKLGGQSTYDKLGGQISATNSVAGNTPWRPDVGKSQKWVSFFLPLAKV